MLHKKYDERDIALNIKVYYYFLFEVLQVTNKKLLFFSDLKIRKNCIISMGNSTVFDRLLQNADYPNYCILQKNNSNVSNVCKVKAFL